MIETIHQDTITDILFHLNYLLQLLGIEGRWFFGKHVLARLQSPHAQTRDTMIRRANEDRIDCRIQKDIIHLVCHGTRSVSGIHCRLDNSVHHHQPRSLNGLRSDTAPFPKAEYTATNHNVASKPNDPKFD